MKFFLTGTFCLCVLFSLSCKKDKTAKKNKVFGEYAMIEIEQQNPYKLEAIPDAAGNYGSIFVDMKTDSTARVQVVQYSKDKKETDRDDFGTVKILKDQDGDIILVDNVGELAWIWEDYEMDFYGYTNFRIGAKKK